MCPFHPAAPRQQPPPRTSRRRSTCLRSTGEHPSQPLSLPTRHHRATPALRRSARALSATRQGLQPQDWGCELQGGPGSAQKGAWRPTAYMGTAHSCAWSSARARLASSPSSPLLVMAPRRLAPPALPTRRPPRPRPRCSGSGAPPPGVAPGLKGVYLAAFYYSFLVSGGCRCLRGRGGGSRCPPGR